MIRLKSNVILSRPKPVFEKNPDISFVSVFYAGQAKPLSLWEKFDGIGSIRRAEENNNSSVQLLGTNTGWTKLATPIRPYTTLGIRLPYMVVALKFINRPCGFDVQIEDSKQIRRLFQFSTRLQTARKRDWAALIPLYLEQNWNEVVLDLQAITKRLYGTDYVETVRIQVYPNCRLRMIYFSKVPMQISKALLVMKILLEEGQHVFDVRKLDEGGTASLTPNGITDNQDPAQDPKCGKEDDTGATPATSTSAVDSAVTEVPADQLSQPQDSSSATTAEGQNSESEAEQEEQAHTAAISLTACGTAGSYKIQPTKLTELLPSNEYWSRTRFVKTFAKQDETTAEGKIQVVILPPPAHAQSGIRLQIQESGLNQAQEPPVAAVAPVPVLNNNASENVA